MVLNRFRWTKRSGLKTLGKDSFRSPRRLPGLGQGGLSDVPGRRDSEWDVCGYQLLMSYSRSRRPTMDGSASL